VIVNVIWILNIIGSQTLFERYLSICIVICQYFDCMLKNATKARYTPFKLINSRFPKMTRRLHVRVSTTLSFLSTFPLKTYHKINFIHIFMV